MTKKEIDRLINLIQVSCNERAAKADKIKDKANSQKWQSALIILQEAKDKIAKLNLPDYNL